MWPTGSTCDALHRFSRVCSRVMQIVVSPAELAVARTTVVDEGIRTVVAGESSLVRLSLVDRFGNTVDAPSALSARVTIQVDPHLPQPPFSTLALRAELVGSHGRWKRACLQTAHMTI
jgi:hypothetical protein